MSDCIEVIKGYLRSNDCTGDAEPQRRNRQAVYGIIQSQKGQEGAIYDLLKCPVCMELVGTQDPSGLTPTTLPCGHSFCRSCLNSMFASRPSLPCICPLCRAAVPLNLLTASRQVAISPSVALAEIIRRITPLSNSSTSSAASGGGGSPRRSIRRTRRRTRRTAEQH